MSRKKKGYVLLLVAVIVCMAIAACDRTEVRGIRERNKLEGEPEIVVELADGGQETMKFEEYVTGVVGGEMKEDWPENAYAAQAIIARTFALKHMNDNQTNVISGSYEFAQEYKPENITERLRDAVKKTRGEVAVYKDDYIKAWFHSSAGGQTSYAKVGLAYEEDEPPYIKSVKSPDDKAPDDVQNWTVSFSNSEISEALTNLGEDIGEIQEIEALDKDDTGRIVELQFTGSKGKATVKAANFRTELDSKKLKSIKISEITKEGNNYIFTGSGFGHGVGMSQWGAYSMADEGKTPEEIINYYFKDIEIVKEYD
ncbi:MAG TPA: SpoIID/LytB domain-containing protein [Halanaerobiales bacterium]|nr:SpoIID/LytB domain-containing protein [Halanaerobiales bacterium]